MEITMQSEDMVVRAVELIKTLPYLNLATSAEGRPWSSPVYAVPDGNLCFYWSSWKDAVHSVNLASNPTAAFTIYDSTRARGTNNYRCLYVECLVTTVTDAREADKAFKMLYPGQAVELADFLAPGLKRFYKATPAKAWLNCLSERELTPQTLKMRVEVDLQELNRSVAAAQI
jgi:hypothetical protein